MVSNDTKGQDKIGGTVKSGSGDESSEIISLSHLLMCSSSIRWTCFYTVLRQRDTLGGKRSRRQLD